MQASHLETECQSAPVCCLDLVYQSAQVSHLETVYLLDLAYLSVQAYQ